MALVNIYAKVNTKEINSKLDTIIKMLVESKKKEIHMSKELDELQAAVEENTTVDQSIMTLVDGMAAQIEALKDDPAKLVALAKALRDSSALTVAKVLANTTQEPPTEPTV
jgi:phosphoglycolate phosphatase-like HAD superfamily hydrolase